MANYVLASCFVTVSGTTPTVQKQQNVASVTRVSTGLYTITFNSTLGDANYGVIANGRLPDSTSDFGMLVVPNRNTATAAAYSTTAVNIICTTPAGVIVEPLSFSVLVFDPSVSNSDIIAAAMYTLSGTTLTLQKQTNMGVTRTSQGIYSFTFTSALADANYSLFNGARYPDFTNDASPICGNNRNPTGSLNLHTTGAFTQLGGLFAGFGPSIFELGKGCALARMSDATASGVLASVRFSISGGVCTIIKSNNVASVTYQATGCYRIAFTSTLASANYALIGTGKWADSAGSNDTPCIAPNRNSSASRNVYSTSAVDIVSTAFSGGIFDPETVDVLAYDPSLLGASAYSVGVTETASAADSPSALGTFEAVAAESASAVDTVTDIAAQGALVTETASAADTVSNGVVFTTSLAEMASAVDTITFLSPFHEYVAESAPAVDTLTAHGFTRGAWYLSYTRVAPPPAGEGPGSPGVLYGTYERVPF